MAAKGLSKAGRMLREILILFFSLLFLSSPDKISGRKSLENSGGYSEQEEEDDKGAVIRRSMFPHDFIFGVATSAYQIEGAYLEDGKGLSNWDVFTHEPGNVPNEDNGDIADDHYHRYMEDIENLQKLGVDAYRFSVTWSRILPKGRFGEVNPSGVKFYNTIIDNLLLKGITPFVTIHHNDVPQELEDRYGSWLSPQIQEDFVHFAKICFEEFGDRVKNWMTINEPNINSLLAYILGWFPPSHCSPPFGNCSVGNSDLEPLIAVHNMLLSHAKTVQLYRRQFQPKQGGRIGLTVHAFHYEPYREDDFSRQAAERAYAFNVAWILDPLVYGEYPPLMRKYLGSSIPKFSQEEVKLVKGSVDFFGINHYSSLYAIDCINYPSDCSPGFDRAILGFACTTGYRDGVPIGQETGYDRFFVVPYGMEKVIDFIRTRYPNTTIYVTENGYNPQGQEILMDSDKIKYHEAYLAALAQAIRKGANVRGYFAWSFIDNFEWLQGYSANYGLYYVNRTTLERTPKLSAKWYAHFLANKTPQNCGKSTALKSIPLSEVVKPTSSTKGKAQI